MPTYDVMIADDEDIDFDYMLGDLEEADLALDELVALEEEGY